MMKNRILYVYTGNHKVHKELAETITKSSVKLSKNLPKNYDVYLFEGAYVLPVLLKKRGKIPKESKIITFFADPRLYYLSKGINFKNNKINKTYFIRKFLSKIALKSIDGVISEGNMNKDLFRKVNKKSPVKVIYPFINENTFRELLNIKPNLDNKDILFIGNGPDEYCKGLDRLIKIFKELNTDSKLYIIGRDWEIKDGWKDKNIFFEGYKNIIPYLKKCSLVVHLGQGEGFGIHIMESLLAGVPVIVSKYTGAKDLVDKNFVVPLDDEIIKQKILEYWGIKDKETLSKKGRAIVKEMPKEKMLKEFKERFDELIELM